MANATDERPIVKKAIEDLLLDKTNPRLADELDGDDQDSLTRTLWRRMAVDEIAQSIAENGYFPQEPLLVVRAAGKPGKYVVVEGNRRLAAVRVLRSEQLRKSLGAQVPKLTASARAKLDKLPVSVYDDREELWRFLGFRHVNGPQPWDAYAKARYIERVQDKYGASLADIARSIGDKHSTVERLYRGLKALEQAEAAGFDREDRVKNHFAFSHLYTALDQPQFRKYVGITGDSSAKRPVPREKLANLKRLVLWLYGSDSKGIAPLVQSQNPDLNVLRDLLGTAAGRRALEAGLGLAQATEASTPDDRRFRDALTQAKNDLERAKATVATGFDGEDEELLEAGEESALLAQSVWNEMKGMTPRPQASRRRKD